MGWLFPAAAASTWSPAFCSAAPGVSPEAHRSRRINCGAVPFNSLTVNAKPDRMCRYLVDVGGKAVVEFHNLLLLLVAYSMDSGVDIYLQRHQQALVDSHGRDGGHLGVPIASPGDAAGSHGPAAEA